MIAVKKNQATLYNQIQDIINHYSPIDMDYTLEKNRGRIEHRAVSIYDPIGIDKKEWVGVLQIVRVVRKVEHPDGRVSHQEAFYIDSTGKSAKDLNQGIRFHWSVEVMHWVKDVVLKEDDSKIHKGNAPEALSIIRNWVMAALKINGHKSIISGIRKVANDLVLMSSLLE